MDISSLSGQYLNNPYVPFSTSVPGLQGGGDNNFADLLRRTQNASQITSQKPVIDKTDKLYELCAELETFLIKNLIKSMRGTVQKSGLIETGFAGEMYEDMLYDEYAKTFSRNANFGFAEMAYRELAKYS